MDKKILIKWLCITLVGAIMFGTLGYMYGSIISTDKCNAFWLNKTESTSCLPIVTANNYPYENIGLNITGG